MQYRPVNTDILPLFVLLHLTFPTLLWLFTPSTRIALVTSVLLYISVQIFGMPAGSSCLACGWYAKDSSGKLRALIRSPAMLAFAILYLAFSLTVALSWQVEAFEAFLPLMLSKVIYAIDKSNLDPLRLLHFFALALVVARLTPQNWPGPSSLWATAAIRCGENSLAIFCFSVLLSFIGHVVLVNTSGAFLMQIVISIAGIGFMIVAATLLTWTVKLGTRERQLF